MQPPAVSLYYWNPKRRRFAGTFLRRLPFYRRRNNFGDILSVWITQQALDRQGQAQKLHVTGDPVSTGKSLLAIGSILHFAKTDDVIWGCGRNGKIVDEKHTFNSLDVRMVRGPLTRQFLMNRGIEVPPIYGDPGILLPNLFPEYVALTAHKRHRLTIIPNLNDIAINDYAGALQSPQDSLKRVIERIARSDLVISSSLHGIIIAEALSVPVRVLRSNVEPTFKYRDYFLGTQREDYPVYDNIAEALRGTSPDKPVYDSAQMLAAFPYDVF